MGKAVVIRFLALLAASSLLVSCDDRDARTYSLYRNSPFDPALRVHWATFDARDGSAFNLGNCHMAAELLNKQAPTGIRWWCEKGLVRA